jgi:hypothetical protein
MSYKHKKLKEQQDDLNTNKIRKTLNVTNRQIAKKVINESIEELRHHSWEYQVPALRDELETEFTRNCWYEENTGPAKLLSDVLYKLDIIPRTYFDINNITDTPKYYGKNLLFRCKCPKLHEMTDEEVWALACNPTTYQ